LTKDIAAIYDMNGKQVAFAATIEYLELKKLETT
jgi:hypothetical protein